MTSVFYNFSGGMESAAMLVVDRERINDTGAVVHWADTGKQFPEMADSIAQSQSITGLTIVTVPRRITFDEFLFERGGMLRKGTTDCSRRMKRSNLNRHMLSYPKPYEANLGFNADEFERMSDFVGRNERGWLHWRFPLIENSIDRAETRDICKRAGFSILIEMYQRMGRFDCFWCPNQRPSQAALVAKHYPDLAAEWTAAETRKGHSFMRLPLLQIVEQQDIQLSLDCSCFGGSGSVADEIEAEMSEPAE